jgi:glutathione synthase/RimK-type ligase-like ATP-grasp enzyme
MSRILMLTGRHDFHAISIQAALIHQGHEVSLFGMDAFPLRDQHSLEFSGDGVRFRSSVAQFDSEARKFDTVWYRRYVPADSEGATETISAPGSDDASFIRRAHTFYTMWLFSCFPKKLSSTAGSFWINSLDAAYHGENKFLQLDQARIAGFNLPETLVTNDPRAVADFRKAVGGPVICKTLVMADAWTESDGRSYASYAALLPDQQELPPDSIRVVPAIYQSYVEKEYEVRTVFMGHHHISVRIDSQQSEASRIDWRARRPSFSFYRMPESLAEKCRRIMRAFSLQYACFDLVRRPDGEYVFLELNQGGQFLFMERWCPQAKVLDAFCHFLVHHTLDGWSAGSAQLTLEQVHSWPHVASQFREIRQYIGELARTGRRARVY